MTKKLTFQARVKKVTSSETSVGTDRKVELLLQGKGASHTAAALMELQGQYVHVEAEAAQQQIPEGDEGKVADGQTSLEE